jgi:uncharacterized protein YdhG (YjbR/CyaY superfamily)
MAASPPKARADREGAARVKAYIAALPPAARKALKQIRADIRSVAPTATDVISYQMPAFKLDGRILIYYAAWKKHTSLYPVGPATLNALGVEPGKYASSKGTIRFPLDKPAPSALVKRIVRSRIADMKRKAAKK